MSTKKKPKMSVTLTSYLHKNDGEVKVIGPRKLKERSKPVPRKKPGKSA